MKRRAMLVAGAAVIVGLGTAGTLAVVAGADGRAAAREPADTTPPKTAAVERTDLVRTQTVDGTLTYGDRTALKASGSGTITGLPQDGTVIERGSALWQVDGHAGPVLLYGDLPMWRTLSNGVDDGPDVRELEENLVALGFADPAKLTVDDEFTSETAWAVKRWQESLGLEKTGRVAPGDAIFSRGPVRVAERKLAEGDRAEGTVLEVTGTTRRVHVDLDAADAALVSQGASVEVTLPDDTTVQGTMTHIATTAEVQEGQQGQDSTTTIGVDIDLANEVKALDESPVEVALISSRAQGVLAVPVEALLALAEGGYAVERVKADGTTELVAVKLGAFADDKVEVSGDLAEGDQVVVP
jgi:peptidoglycan hydrolase-like protein with peptidoglycan-binding domain